MNILTFDTPSGTLAVGAYSGMLKICDWIHSPHFKSHLYTLKNLKLDREYTLKVIAQIKEYFSGQRNHFDVNIAPEGTDFRLKVWNALLSVEFGSTASYSDIATKIGNKSAVRAVANAIAHNPISIVIPCHIIIGSNGSITGYAGGIDCKRILLTLENPDFRVK